MLDTTIQVKTDNFDGPLGLLLMLVQKEEMSVKDLDLTKITSQYLGYLAEMRDLNFDIAGDYLYLAATLLLLKSKNCITEEEQERLKDQLSDGEGLNITSSAELIRRLEELQHFQKMGEKLWSLDKRDEHIFVKPKINRKAIVNSILTPMELEKLTMAMMDFLFRERRKYTVVKRDRLSIKEKLVFLRSHLEVGQKTTLQDLLDNDGGENLDNKVITFISLLELARLQRLEVFQNESMGSIYVDVVKSLEDFDVTQADGFEDEDELAEKAISEDIANTIAQNGVEIAEEPLSANEMTHTQQDAVNEEQVLQ
ncbi:ScpA family protein [Halobacteriovorax sp. HLS]|uniref:segregation and condensation protein A n=1 Tax=Halobacteriovorax sp. HLS TaxID=2234000 RepID=UPI000FDCC844|nr:segregation/condensation protein A [Halobacteriovorax sp. HLS]